jgi:5-carboxymethyl-2-hydroxymuconate isomerase
LKELQQRKKQSLKLFLWHTNSHEEKDVIGFLYTDVHGTTADTGIFTIVTNPTKENMLLAEALPPEKIVIWESSTPSEHGPLTRFVSCGVEIEAGRKDDQKRVQELTQMILSICKDGISIQGQTPSAKKQYRVYGKLKKDSETHDFPADVREFQEITYHGETFAPLLLGEYPDVHCYKMHIVD